MQGSQYNRPSHRHNNNFQSPNQFQKVFGSNEKLSMVGNAFNMQANFSTVQGCDEFQPRGTTRVVYTDGTCATFSTSESFPSCTIPGTVLSTDQKGLSFQQQQQFPQNKPFRQQNPMFRNQEFVHQNYVHRNQNPTRFVRLQGSKMKQHISFRNFGNQNQNRRFKNKNFNYKMQRMANFSPVGNTQQHESPDCQQHHCRIPIAVTEAMYPSIDTTRMKAETSVGGTQKKIKFKKTFKSPKKEQISSKQNGDRGTKGKMKLLEPKVEVDFRSPRHSPHNLSYDDVSENSDENEDVAPDTREQLGHKKIGPVVKREPGEIYSDDESMCDENTSKKVTPEQEKAQSKLKSATSGASSIAVVPSDSGSCKKKKKKSGSSLSTPRTVYSCHDDRCAENKTGSNEVKGRTDEIGKTMEGSYNFCGSSALAGAGPRPGSSKVYCCPEAEVVDLRERIREMKQSLRDKEDELLEVKVIGSKKSLRMQSEIDQLKTCLVDKDRVEKEMNVSLKKAKDALAQKAAELSEITLRHEADKQENARVQTDLSRTYQDRLAIETEKLRALFDVEVAKMQAYYLQG